ncbi:MAG: DUF1266 domain-containing protein [Candidatus Tritonobacter lacicola]|nr:DUF1266 domain-containing protein [Candidatus Tritonobacter lacicola]
MNARARVYFLVFLIAAAIGCRPGIEEKDRAPLAREQAWALAASALLAERNDERHDLLGGRERIAKDMEMWRAGLVKGWNVGDHEDLLATLRLLEEEGDRKEFTELGAHVTSLSKRKYKKFLKKARRDAELYNRIQLAKEHHDKLGEKSLAGWDYCRYISLCRWGYLAGYFTEEEAWARIIPAASKLQGRFDSWEDLGANYLIGREFWSHEDTVKNGLLYRAAYRRLLDNPGSPWNVYLWDMEMEEPRGGQGVGLLGR